MILQNPRTSADRHIDLMRALARYIEKHADEPLVLKTLAEQTQLSPSHLQRVFKGVLGISPKAYHAACRMRRLKDALRSQRSVLQSITDAGFGSTSRVYGPATRTLGMTPSAYRAGGAGESIAFACRRTALGALLMAATDRGVCFAQFGLDEQSLVGQLRQEFPKATVRPSDAARSSDLDAWIDALEAHLAGRAPHPDVPLDLRGTAFQIRVWRFLLNVPEGDIVSYTEVARGIGNPKAVRAAAAACAANRVAVLVPCHRVLCGNGELGGYRWGVERKRLLIGRERRPQG